MYPATHCERPAASPFAAVRGPGVKCHVTMFGRESEGDSRGQSTVLVHVAA